MKELNWFEKLWIKLFDKSWLYFDEKFPEVGDNVEILVIFTIPGFTIRQYEVSPTKRIFKSVEPFKWVIDDKKEWIELLDRDTKWRIKK